MKDIWIYGYCTIEALVQVVRCAGMKPSFTSIWEIHNEKAKTIETAPFQSLKDIVNLVVIEQ